MIDIEIKNDEITAALARLSAVLTDTTPVMEDFGEYLVKSTKDRFPAGVAPDGSVWAAKSPATLAAYGARKSNRIDVRPLFGPSGALSTAIFADAFPDRVEWGSNMVYARVMQFGAGAGAFGFYSGIDKNGRSFSGVAPWGDIPARPFLGISPEDEANLIDIVAEALIAAAGGGG